ncbi:MAG: HipA domain-containing protein [Thermoleophilia bacterium]|nr:HipA domain-containing protein [Thermoleophilia bacterium]
MSELRIWLEGEHIGNLSRARGTLVFTHTAYAIATATARPLVSVAMPVRRAPYRGDVVAAFFDGLLPEGEARRMLAHDFDVDTDDAYGMLERIGRDCAGALEVLTATATPTDVAGAPELLTDAQVAARLAALRSVPLGIDERVRVSLPGVQEKLVLSSTPEGWALPLDGRPSTHILKPAHPFLPRTVVNEAFCLAIARHAGVSVAAAQLHDFGAGPVLVIERFDRTPSPLVRRIHQEDLCQATGTSTRHKYEALGGPSLQRVAQLLQLWTRGEASLRRLLDIAVLNVALGNADAHAKNLSIAYDADGRIELAPAYDLMCTRAYEQVETTAGMFVNDVQQIDQVSREDLIAEGASWGLDAASVAEQVDALLQRLPAAVVAASSELAVPTDIHDVVARRVEQFSTDGRLSAQQ